MANLIAGWAYPDWTDFLRGNCLVENSEGAIESIVVAILLHKHKFNVHINRECTFLQIKERKLITSNGCDGLGICQSFPCSSRIML